MSEERKAMYVGSAKQFTTQHGTVGISVDLDMTKLSSFVKGEAADLVKEFTDRAGNPHKSIRLSIFPSQEQYVTEWSTHSVRINTFKPERKAEQPADEPEPKSTWGKAAEVEDEDLPF